MTRTLKEINNFYRTSLREEVVFLEQQRVTIRDKTRIIGIVVLCISIVIFFPLYYFLEMLFQLALSLLIISFCTWAWLSLKLSRDYRYSYWKRIIEPLLRYYDKSLSFSVHECIPESVFVASNIFNQKCFKYKGRNLVSGQINSTNISFSQVNVECEGIYHEDIDGYPLFDGIFFVGELERDLFNDIIIIPKEFRKHGKKKNLPVIKIESPEFNDNFVIYARKRISTKKILESELAQKILHFKKDNNRHLYISVIGSRLFFAVKHNEQIFEPKLKDSILEFRCVQPYFEELLFFAELIEVINSKVIN